MRKLVLKMDISVDGFIGRADDSVDWVSGSRSDDGAAWGFWSTGYGFWWKNSGGLLYFRYVGYH